MESDPSITPPHELPSILNRLRESLADIEDYWKAGISLHEIKERDIQSVWSALDKINWALDKFARIPSENIENDVAWLASFPETNPNPILEIGLDGCVGYANPAIRKLFPTLVEQGVAHSYLAGWQEVVNRFLMDPGLNLVRDVSINGQVYQQAIFFVEDYQRFRVYGRDITERKRAEEALEDANTILQEQADELEVQAEELTNQNEELLKANRKLRENEESLRDYLEGMHDMFLALDRQWRVVYANRGFSEVMGYRPEQLIGKDFWQTFPNYRDTVIERNYHRVMTERSPLHFEIGGVYTQKWYAVSLYPTLDGMAAFISDRTEENNAHQTLAAQTVLLESVIEEQQDIVLLYDPGMNVKRANHVFQDTYGFDPVGKNVKEIVGLVSCRNIDGSPLDWKIQPTPQAVKGNKVTRMLFLVRRPDGSDQVVETSSSPLIIGDQITGAVTVWHDITDLKKAQERLQQKNELLSLLTDAAAELLAGADPIARLDEFFSRAGKILGLEVYVQYNLSEDGKCLKLGKLAGFPDRYLKVLSRLELGQAVCGTVAQTRRPMYVNDVQSQRDRKTRLIRKLGIGTYACHPLMVGDRLLGTLSFGSRARTHFDPDTIGVLRTFCNLVAEALDRKRIEEEIKEAERKYRELIQFAPVGIYELDFRKQIFTSVNDVMCQLTGYSREELLRMNPLAVLDEPSQVIFKERMGGWLAGEKPGDNVEYRVLAKDGHEIYAVLNVSFTTGDDGKPLGATVIGYDITERKQREAEREQLLVRLKEQRQIADSLAAQAQQRADELETIMDTVPAIIWVSRDPECSQMTGNRYSYEFLGNQAGTNVSMSAPSEERTFQHKAIKDGKEVLPCEMPMQVSAATGKPSLDYEFDVRFEDGKIRHLIGNANPLLDVDGRPNGAVSAFIDITEKKHAEQLDKALNRINEILHSQLDFDLIMQNSLSEAAEALECDTAAVSLRRGNQWIVRYVHGFSPDVIGSLMNDDEEQHAVLAIQTKKPVAVQNAESDERFNRDHLKKWGIKSVLIVPILSNHEAIGVFFFNYQRSVFEFQNCHVDFGVQLASSIAMALDNIKLIETLKGEVVVRKQAERDLARANASLEKRVLERTKELNEANEKLQSAYQELELVDEELKVQNDELEKALAGEKSLRLLLIQSEKYAALARLVGSVAHEINNPIQTVKNCLYLIQSEKTSKEAGAILNMAESELQRIANLVQQLRDTYRPSKLQPVDFSPIDMLNKVSGLLTGQMRENNVCWHLHHEENDLTIHGIPDQIQQVFLNICLNAIEAMSPKGGQLDVAVCRLPEEKKIRITFQDTGPGIPQSIIDQVFEPFYTTKTKGTGLGLAICYEIVKSHGGEIAVVSPPGTGATFDIVLPIQ